MAELHIASCIVRMHPDVPNAAIIGRIEAIAGCSVSANDVSGRLVIVIEGMSTGALLEQMAQMREIPGVLSVDMVYQHAEDESEMRELLT